MIRAATFGALAVLATHNVLAAGDSAKPAAIKAPAAQAVPAKPVAKAPMPGGAGTGESKPVAPEATPTAPKPPPPASPTATPVAPAPAAPAPAAVPAQALSPAAAAAAAALKDSATARQYRVRARGFNKDEAKQFLKVFKFQSPGRPESTAVNWVYQDKRGAMLTYERDMSEFAFSFDSIPYLDSSEYIPDSLIRMRSDAIFKAIFKEKSDQYAFVNYEIDSIQRRDTTRKKGAFAPVPAYYYGRYLRKLNSRYVLGDRFQVRLSFGRGSAVNFMSYRNPVLSDSFMVKVPTREMVQAYLAKWARSKTTRRMAYPYHPDNLRIRDLKPVKVFESYVLVEEKFPETPEKDGLYLVPRITVLAQASIYPTQKRLKMPAPKKAPLMHFHFPCTPQAGLCWPDNRQDMHAGEIRPSAPPRVLQLPLAPQSPSPKSGAAPAGHPPAGPAAK